MQSFFNFRLEWPDTITNAITIFRSVATIVAFVLMAWPGVGCLVVIEYESKLYLRTMLPALIGLMMGCVYVCFRVQPHTTDALMLCQSLFLTLHASINLCVR